MKPHIANRQDFIDEGLRTLTVLEKDWLNKSVVLKAPTGNSDLPGRYLWNWASLEKAVGRDLVPFAAAAFSLEKDGNIPSEVDPLGTYFRLSSLRSRLTTAELATQMGITEQEAATDLTTYSADEVLDYRWQAMARYYTEQMPAAIALDS